MSAEPALSISACEFSYPDGHSLSFPAFELAAGEQALLRGASGSGKSTLLHLIAGIETGARGGMRVAGAELSSLHGAKLDSFRGRNIGLVFQTFHLLQGFSAVENLLVALHFSSVPVAEHQRRANELLQTLGIDAPHKLVDRLSVGQQQRVAIARALVAHPAVVLADEPTASLDPANAATAISLLQSACGQCGAALLLASHDPAIGGSFSRVIELGSVGAAP